MRWTQYQWINSLSQLCTIPSDTIPVVSKILFSNLHSGLSTLEMNYEPNGIRVKYDVHQAENTFHPNAFIDNTLGHNGDLRPVDTIKVFCYTKAPPTMCTQLTKFVSEIPVTSERENSLHCFLSAGYISIDELGSCLQGIGSEPLEKAFLHNFTPQGIQFQISDAVVHINGVRCTSAEHLRSSLATERSAGRMRVSMMHTIEERSNILNTNVLLFGQSVMNKCEVPKLSIGSMMMRALSLNQIHGESIPMFMMGEMYKTDKGSICPEVAVHFAGHAHNITGNAPHDADLGASLYKTYTPARKLTTAQMLALLHTSYQGPCYSAEMTPYTSDLVLSISPETVQSMCHDTFQFKFGAKDFVVTECIDNAFSLANDSKVFRANDCEGGAAMLVAMQSNMRAVFSDATRHLSQCETQEGKQQLSLWLKQCNVNIPTHMQYAFVVQLVALSAASNICTDLKTMLVGAMCATPLQSGQTQAEECREQGHCCCCLQVNEKSITSILDQIYTFYSNENSKGIILKLPKSGPILQTTYTSHDQVKDILVKPAVHPCALSDDLVKAGYHILWPGIASEFPHNDIAASSSFYLVESTTALHWCPVNGHIAKAKMQSLIDRPGQISNVGVPAAIPVEAFARDWLLKDVRPYITCCEDVRLEGFLHNPADGSTNEPNFYSSFYQMDSFALHQIQKDGSLRVGVDAMQLLTSINDPGTKLTLEKVQLPSLSVQENQDLMEQMHATWNESRMPTMGRNMVCTNLSSWHAATISCNHAPEDREKGVMRCNISISGDSSDQLYTDMSAGGSRAMSFAASDHGIVADMRVIRMGKNTTILSQSVRVKHLM
jgi:hypothetical protein